MQLLTAFVEMDKTGAPLADLERTAAGLAEDVEKARLGRLRDLGFVFVLFL